MTDLGLGQTHPAFRWSAGLWVSDLVSLAMHSAGPEDEPVISRCVTCHEEFAEGEPVTVDVMDEWREAVVVRFFHVACVALDGGPFAGPPPH